MYLAILNETEHSITYFLSFTWLYVSIYVGGHALLDDGRRQGVAVANGGYFRRVGHSLVSQTSVWIHFGLLPIVWISATLLHGDIVLCVCVYVDTFAICSS